MASQWYYQHDGQQHGPVSSTQLKLLPQSGQLLPTDLVWKEGMSGWVPAEKLNGLFTPSNVALPPQLAPIATGSDLQATLPAAPAASAQLTSAVSVTRKRRRLLTGKSLAVCGAAIVVATGGFFAVQHFTGGHLASIPLLSPNTPHQMSGEEFVKKLADFSGRPYHISVANGLSYGGEKFRCFTVEMENTDKPKSYSKWLDEFGPPDEILNDDKDFKTRCVTYHLSDCWASFQIQYWPDDPKAPNDQVWPGVGKSDAVMLFGGQIFIANGPFENYNGGSHGVVKR